jgi:hypothetical protein
MPIKASFWTGHRETLRDIAYGTEVGLTAVPIMYIPESCRWNTLGGVTSPHKYVKSVDPQELIYRITYLECQIREGRASDRLRQAGAEDS